MRRLRVWAGVGLLAGVSTSSCADLENPGGSDVTPSVQFVSPNSGDVVTGLADVELEIVVPEGIEIEESSFGVDEPSTVRELDETFQLKSRNFDDGTHTLVARIVDAEGNVFEDTVEVVFENPNHELLNYQFDQADYQSGDEVVLNLNYSEADLEVEVDYSAIDADFDANAVNVVELGDGEYQVVYTLSDSAEISDGEHEVTIVATNADGKELALAAPIRLRNMPMLPIGVSGGVFVDAPAPKLDESVEGAPRVEAIVGDVSLLSGGVAALSLTISHDPEQPADRLVVAAEGYSGYFVVPLGELPDEETVEVHLELALPVDDLASGDERETVILDDTTDANVVQKTAAPPKEDANVDADETGADDSDPDDSASDEGNDTGIAFEEGLNLSISAANLLGQTAGATGHDLSTFFVGDGSVQANLSWNTPADLDISVIDPDDNLIDFASPTQGTGALTLDSNALCEDGPRAESVGWPLGLAPQGSYQVRVNLFDDCGEASTNWTVRATFCGKSVQASGTFTSDDVDQTGEGREGVTFEVDCTHIVQGQVRFLKRGTIRPAGASSATTLKPIANAPIYVRSATDDSLLGKGVSKANGNYTVPFLNPDAEDYYLQIEAAWTDPTFSTSQSRLRVTPVDDDTPYISQTAPFDGALSSSAANVTLTVAATTKGGAFNIRDVVMRGYQWVNANAPSVLSPTLGRLRARWTKGQATEITKRNGDKVQLSYQTGSSLFMNGVEDDQDEWDDSVIMHEFMHFVVRNLSYSPLPGGSHSGRSTPKLAFSEGLATGLGQIALGHPMYSSENLSGAFVTDIERGTRQTVRNETDDLSAASKRFDAKYKGTDDGQHTGKVSEYLIAMLLWDLNDASNETHDRFDQSLAWYALSVVFNPLPTGSFNDRDGNGIDLVDYLDHHRTGVAGLFDQQLFCLTNERNFKYDQFPSGISCP